MRKLFCFLVFFAGGGGGAPLSAEPLYTTSQCSPNVSFGNSWHGSGKEITYYVEDTFASEMQSCLQNQSSPPSWASSLQQSHVTAGIKAAAEIWNAQSRGMALKYGGYSSISDGNSACALGTPTNPAVLITFEPGCYVNPQTNQCQTQVGRVTQPCDNVTWWRFFGNDGVKNACPSTSTLNQFSIGTYQGFTDFVGIAVHEFGHVLGAADNPSAAGSNTIMQQGSVPSDRRHLFAWDQDCLDEASQNNGREVYHSWIGINYSGAFGYFGSHSFATSRGQLSGGYQWDPSAGVAGMPFYGLFSAGTQTASTRYIEYGYPAASFWLSFPNYILFAPPTIDTTPVFYRAEEHSLATEGSRLNYQSRSTAAQDPPQVRTRWSTNIFGTSNDQQFVACDNVSCTSTSTVFSHVPLTTAFDPVSGKTIFVRVNTSRGSLTNYGDIFVHPGFLVNAANYTLAQGSQLSAGGTSPTLPSSGLTGWPHSAKTDTAVGVACGDDTSNFPYNCLLAWQDSTVPNGRVLYTYFKVGAGSTIDFHPNAWIRGGSQTVGHVSAAYFADRYYLAWKRWTAPADASYTINDSTSYTGWSTVNNYDAEDIVDPPTWLYRDDDATSNGILWTEL